MDIRKLSKICFLVDVLCLGTLGNSATDCQYSAEERGPVIVDLENSIQEISRGGRFLQDRGTLRLNPAVNTVDSVAKGIPANQRKKIEEIVAEFGHLSWEHLSEITHEIPAWIATPQGQVIDQDLMTLPYRFGPIEGHSGVHS